MNIHRSDRYLRLAEVLSRTGLSRATLYRKIQTGTFPPQRKISARCCGWLESEITIWMNHPITFTLDILEREAA